MTSSGYAGERTHVRATTLIDRVFRPCHDDDAAYWEAFWTRRLSESRASGRIFEHDTPGKCWLYQEVGRALERVYGPIDDAVVTEYGCGSGYTVLRLAERTRTAVAVDASPAALRYAGYVAEMLGVGERARLVRSDLLAASHGQLPDGFSDLTFSSGVIEHESIADATAMVREMQRITRPGGAVVVLVPNLLAPVTLGRMVRSRSKGTERFYSSRLVRRICRDVGLTDVRSHHPGLLVPAQTPGALLPAAEWAGRRRWTRPLSAMFCCSGRVATS